jgi:hypothetical protein
MRLNRSIKHLSLIIISLFFVACSDITKPIDTEVYLPIGMDKDGCMRYRLKPTTQMSTQVIIYKSINGGYTPNKNTSNCR